LIEYDEDPKTKVKIRSERLLTWAEFREMVLDAMEDTIVSLTDLHLPGRNQNAWNMEGLQRGLKDTLNAEMSFENAGSREDVQEQIYKVAEKTYTSREKEFGEEFHRFCQVRFLSTIDQLWKDHLLAMDHLRQGIGLRGYGQKDPKQEYKKEGYDGFIRMMSAISQQFVSQLMRVPARNTAEETARLQKQLAQKQRNVIEGRGDASGKAAPAQSAPRPSAVREGPRVGRNDPCPCGSGKKFKKCHGSAEAA
jgi:preprotein translocase subunit SecA